MLKLGDMGTDVKELQQWLISIGALNAEESYFNIKTRKAVELIQQTLGLHVDGIYTEQLKNIYILKSSLDTQLNPIHTRAGETEVEATNNSTAQMTFNDSNVVQTQDIPCYIVNLLTNDNLGRGVIYLPHLPEEFTYSKGNIWEEQQTKGRSEPYQGYAGSSALTCEINVTISADYAPNHDLEDILNKIENLTYPRYGNMVVPPKAFFRCGTFALEGVVGEVSITRKLPIIDGKYSIAEVSISFTETHAKSVSAYANERYK